MKSTITITSLILATIAISAVLGWVYAINSLAVWCERYVALSMLTPAPKSNAQIVIRAQRKAIAPKAVSITIKNERPDYAQMTIRELKALAKGTAIKNWSRMTKAALVVALLQIN